MSFNRWEWFWKNRVSSGAAKKPGSLDYANEAIDTYMKNKNSTSSKSNSVTSLADWHLLGPYSTASQNMGIVVSFSYSPTSNTIYVGSNTAGLWKSVNGGGSWKNMTDISGLPGMGVQSIVVDPNNTNIVYIATGLSTYGRSYGVGVLKSIDGGATWISTQLSYDISQSIPVQKLIMDPTNSNILYALTGGRVYRTLNGGANWSIILTPLNSHSVFRDIEFKPNDHNTLYVASDNTAGEGAELLRISDASTNFPSTFPLTPKVIASNSHAATTERIGIAVTPADPTGVYILYSDDAGFTRLEKSTDDGMNWTLIHSFSDLLGGIGYWTLEFEISTTNANIMYTGSTLVAKSIDGGNSFTPVSDYYPCATCKGHADIRAMKIYPGWGGGSDIVVMGNDGGISVTSDGASTWQNLNGFGAVGLVLSQFYGLGGSEINTQVIEGGTQDNDIFTKSTSWYNSISSVGDGYDCAIDKVNPLYGYGASNSLVRTTDGGQTWSGISAPVSASLTDRPILMNPKNKALYVGYHDVYMCTTPRGSITWQQLSDFTASFGVPAGAKLVALEVADSFPNIIYAGFENPTYSIQPLEKKLFKTIDGGVTWQDITNNLGAFVWAGLTDIETNPQDPQKVWLSFNQFWTVNGIAVNRVVKSENGGNSWIDYSEGLPDFPCNTLVYKKGSTADEGLYLGNDIGVYFRNPSMSEWKPFNSYLPKIIVTDLDINYATNVIRASTFGRGIWESPLSTDTNFPASVVPSLLPSYLIAMSLLLLVIGVISLYKRKAINRK